MTSELSVALLAGGFGIGGGLGGVLLQSVLSRKADGQRLRAEDARRWLGDRRTVYAGYLGLTRAMLRDIDGLGVFLSHDGTGEIADDDDELISDGLIKYMMQWDDELQPALGEVQLLASPEVADLADRVSGALMELTSAIESRGAYKEHSSMWFLAEEIHEVLRNAMREELGLPKMNPTDRSNDWPWLGELPLGSR